jgi:Protein of unknown function (DUF1579)
MNSTMKTMGLTVAVVLVLSGPSWADDAKSIPSPDALLKLLADAGKPGPEHQKLQPLIGDWTFTLKLWTDPSQSPAELKGTVERKWIMDGRFVQETVKGEANGKSFEGLGLIGYHSGEKKFSTVRACGLCGTISHGYSTFDSAGTKLVCATEECCPLTGQKIKGRDEVTIESNDRIVTNIYKTIEGKEAKVIEIVYTRKN